jgi:hypothetical protein
LSATLFRSLTAPGDYFPSLPVFAGNYFKKVGGFRGPSRMDKQSGKNGFFLRTDRDKTTIKTKLVMKPNTNSAKVSTTTPANRRAFLKGLGALGAGSLVCSRSALADSARYAHRFQLFAAGTVTDFSLVWPTPQIPPLPPNTIIRVRLEFPLEGRDILKWETFLAADSAPDQPLAIVTLYHLRIDKINLSETPAPNFGLFGQIIDNPIVDNPERSPFGDLTGRIGIIYGQFDAPGDNTTFSLLGGAACGSHASAVPTARGSLDIRGPWSSF